MGGLGSTWLGQAGLGEDAGGGGGRNITPAAAAQCMATQLACALFVEMHFRDSIQYVWSGYGSIAWNGQTWLGMGHLASVGTITEDSTITAQGITLGLSGIDNTLLPEALSQVQQGLPCKVSLAFFNPDASIVADPILVFAGRMDQPTLEEGADTSTISIAVENRLADLQRPLVRRCTDQDQRHDYPRDSGYAFVAQLMEWNSAWGINSKGQ